MVYLHLLRKYATCIYIHGCELRTKSTQNPYFSHLRFFSFGSDTGCKRSYCLCSTEGNKLLRPTITMMCSMSISWALDPALSSRKYSQWNLVMEEANIILMASPSFSHSVAILCLHFKMKLISYWQKVVNSYWKISVFTKLSQTEHVSVFSSPVIPGLMNELTNERGFACLGLPLWERLISIQYAKLLRTQDFIQALAFTQQTHWSALRPLGPSLILQDPVVNILRLIHLSSQINY